MQIDMANINMAHIRWKAEKEIIQNHTPSVWQISKSYPYQYEFDRIQDVGV